MATITLAVRNGTFVSVAHEQRGQFAPEESAQSSVCTVRARPAGAEVWSVIAMFNVALAPS